MILEGRTGEGAGSGAASAVEMRRKIAEGMMLSASIVVELL